MKIERIAYLLTFNFTLRVVNDYSFNKLNSTITVAVNLKYLIFLRLTD